MIEVDFIPVGDKTDTGDAILSRFTEPVSGTERVILIDGGFTDTADDIAAHVQQYYGTSRIDLMVCTHPDDDHINGLFGVLERLEVTTLLIHRPADYGHTSDDVKAGKVDELIRLAQSQGTAVVTNAFAGTTFFSGAIMMAGPTEEFYTGLLAEDDSSRSFSASVGAILRASAQAVKNALMPRGTDPGEGELDDDGGVTARNNTSIVLDVQVDGARALFTGDAGAPALIRAADHLDSSGRSAVGYPDFFDVPHHGSRHNLTTEVMNRLAGPIVGATETRTAFVSVGKEADDFPRPEVANAFTRRGYEVCATRGQRILWHRGSVSRPGWVQITPLPWLQPDA